MADDLVCRRFSRAAACYGAAAHLQAEIADELTRRLGRMPGARVVDVGAGDGAVARALVDAGVCSISLDAAWGMVHAGRSGGGVWLQADAAALPLRAQSCDAVVSASAYQWVQDLPGAFSEARRVLKPGGCFVAAMFGRTTLAEFLESLGCAASSLGKSLPLLKRLPDADEVRRALACSGLRQPQVDVVRREMAFTDVKALLLWLHGIGANGLASGFFWGKSLLAATEKEYRARFCRDERLCAGFEVIWIEGKA